MDDWFNNLKIPPQLAGVLLAMVVAIVRVIYDQKETRLIRILLESCMCGGLSLTISYAITAMGMDVNWSIFAGGVVGYIGSNAVRTVALKLINKEVSK